MDDLNSRQEINKYRKFKKVDGATYRKVNQFLRKRTYITAREWALARLCTDFRTSGGAEMTFIGQHLPELVPFMEDTYSPQAVNQARNAFKKKVRKSSATFFYGAMCGFFTTDELDDLLFEASEVARFLLEVEGTTLDIDEEIDIEDRITKVMRGVGEAAKTLLKNRNDESPSKDPIVSTDPSTPASSPETAGQEPAASAAEAGTQDRPILPVTPDPPRPESVSPVPAATGPATELPDENPAHGEDPAPPGTRVRKGTEDPVHPGSGTSGNTPGTDPGNTDNTLPEKEAP
jgi:hypothetical protein